MRLPRLFWLTISLGVAASPAKSKSAEPPPVLKLLSAVKTAIENNPQLRSQNWQVELSRGQLQQASGQFDATLSGTASAGKDLRETPLLGGGGLFRAQTTLRSYDVSLGQQLRNGIVISPEATVTQTDDNYQTPVPTNVGEFKLSVSVPLLKGLGTLATAGTELAAKANVEATQLLYAHAMAQTVQGTVSAYWNYVAARHRLDILVASEQRAQRLLDQTGALIQAQMVPAVEIEKLKANLSDHNARRLMAGQDLESARHALGLAMGLPFDAILALPLPGEDFPEPAPLAEFDGLDRLDWYRTTALQSRRDYLAAQNNQRALDILYRSARANERPRADLGLQVGYTGLDFGTNVGAMFGPVSRNTAGPTYGAQLTFDWPLANRGARGFTLQQRAQYEQAAIQTAEAARSIQSSVTLAVGQLRTAWSVLQSAQDADRLYRGSLGSERQKFQLGESTVIDLLTLEDRLDNASTSLVAAQQLYANALVALRFETGTLVEGTSGNFDLPASHLNSPPVPPAGP